MTIQIPNPGTGVPADQTGDSPWLAMKKVADNFSNPAHAANKLVGTDTGQVPLAENIYKAAFSNPARRATDDAITDVNNLPSGTRYYVTTDTSNKPPTQYDSSWNIETRQGVSGNVINQIALGGNNSIAGMYLRNRNSAAAWGSWSIVYTSANTTVDSNGFIKRSSPIIKVHADKVKLNDDAKQQDITFTKNDIGDYTISGTSGLSTDGWYIELPLDLNGNPKVAVTLSETDGTIELKCYKRTFNMTTFVFEPDLDEPLDIPDERWIDLRLNETPVEHSEPPSEV